MKIKRHSGEVTVIDNITVQIYENMGGTLSFFLSRVGYNETWGYNPETLIKIANWLQMKDV